MRIVHITPTIFEQGNRGGGERYFNEYVSALGRLEDSIKLFRVTSPNFGLASVDAISPENFERRPANLRELYKSIRAADLIHVHQLNSRGFDHSVIATSFGGPPILISDYGAGGGLTPGRAFGRQRNTRIRGLAAISKWSVRDVDPNGVIDNTIVVYGGGDHVLRYPGDFDSRYDADFLFVGRLLPHKGAHVVIQALPRGAKLLVAGETRDEEYFSELRRLATGKNVEFIGSPNDDLLPTLYRSARFSVLPSVESYGADQFTRPELLGLVVLEAMACGTPVIGSATGGLSEVLELTGQYSARPGDVADWSAVMSKALNGPRVRPPSLFTWDSVARSTRELYCRVVSSVQ